MRTRRLHRVVAHLMLGCLCGVRIGWADEPKNHDFDVIREEARVPAYQLPPLSVSSAGQPIKTPEDWYSIRRPEILALFASLLYGVVPQPESLIRTTFEVVATDRQFMSGKATRKDVRIRFENAKGSAEILILVFTPNGSAHPVPARCGRRLKTHGSRWWSPRNRDIPAQR